jgi:mannose-6-phosphate isomerase class I
LSDETSGSSDNVARSLDTDRRVPGAQLRPVLFTDKVTSSAFEAAAFALYMESVIAMGWVCHSEDLAARPFGEGLRR